MYAYLINVLEYPLYSPDTPSILNTPLMTERTPFWLAPAPD